MTLSIEPATTPGAGPLQPSRSSTRSHGAVLDDALPRDFDAFCDFEVRTVSCDRFRALVRVAGAVADDAATLLARVLEDHQRAGRRFVRLDLRGVRTLSSQALAVLRRTHETLLAARGTLILTGVDARISAMLERDDPDGRLFLIAPTAADVAPRP
jgi:anti-anti-sigma regulatory factor